MLDKDKIAAHMFSEMSAADERAMGSRLAAAGLPDIALGDVLLLCAMQMRGAAGGRRPTPGNRRAPELTDRLVAGGYLEDSGADLTERGRRAVLLVVDGVLEDRWRSFRFRPDDIVVSAPAKCGTTWMQMICALLTFLTPQLPAPLRDLSPWLDDPMAIREEVVERYGRQRHRRFVKTHTSPANIPTVPGVTYIVVGRHPLDAAVSFYHQQKRLDEASGSMPGPDPARAWLLEWMARQSVSPVEPSPLESLLRHFGDAWARREQPGVVLVHYDDLSADLEGQMRRLAARLGIAVEEDLWPDLVKAASFEHMRANADRIEPFSGLLADSPSFFRRGGSGSGAELLTPAELAGYERRAAEILEPDVLAWLHREMG